VRPVPRPWVVPQLALLLLLALLPLALPEGAWANPIVQLVEDGEALAVSPLHWEAAGWGWFGVAGAGGVGLYQVDDRIRNSVQDHRGNLGDRAAEVGNAFGDGLYVLPALAATAWWGAHSGDGRLYAASGRAVEAFLFAGAAAVGGKVLTGRARPVEGLGPHDWSGPRTGPDSRLSFPSGHSTVAFAVASVLARSYPGRVVPTAAYGAATLTAFARVEGDHHWTSDVWAGAAVGLWIGHTLMGLHPASGGRGPEAEVVPRPGGAEVRLTWRN
jgi:membrane-associated phospholipid phosphatase